MAAVDRACREGRPPTDWMARAAPLVREPSRHARGSTFGTVQELLGHSSPIEMTMRYAHLSPDARRDAVTKLDDPLPKRGTYMAQDSEPSAKGLKSVD